MGQLKAEKEEALADKKNDEHREIIQVRSGMASSYYYYYYYYYFYHCRCCCYYHYYYYYYH